MPDQENFLDPEIMDIFQQETEVDELLRHYHQVLVISEDDRSIDVEEAFARYFRDAPELAALRPKLYDMMFRER